MKCCLCISLIAVMFHVAAGEAPLKATLSVTASVPVIPDSFVVLLVLKQKGPDTKSAMESLAAARKAAIEKLKGLGAKDAIDDEPPRLVEAAADNPMTRAMRMAQGGSRLKKKKPADSLAAFEVELQQTITVPFALNEKDPSGLFLEGENLKTAVRAAKLLPDSEDDAETDDDNTNMMMSAYGVKKHGPLEFEFRSSLGAEGRRAVYTEGLKLVREKGKALATSAGLSTADIVSMTVVEQDLGDNENPQLAAVRAMMGGGNKKRQEFISGETPNLKVSATVTAEFQLK